MIKLIQAKSVIFSIAVILFSFLNIFARTNSVSKVWVADNGDGTYKNPILHADYYDPDAIRVGGDFYMTASSFNAAFGLPILHLKDLVNWELINCVFQKQNPADVFDRPNHGGGVCKVRLRTSNKIARRHIH